MTIKRMVAFLFDIGMYINPVTLIPQPIEILIRQDASGVSLPMFILFCILQTIISIHGKINVQSKTMYYGMGTSAIISLITIILIIYFRYLK